MINWISIGHLEEIPKRGARIIQHHGHCIGVFRTIKDQVYAIDNRCPHKGGPLSEGIVHGDSVTCPLHNQIFSLATGECMEPETGQVTTYPLHVDQDGNLFIDSNSIDADNIIETVA